MERIKVIIEQNVDGSYTAVPQHDYPIGYFGKGKTVEEALKDLDNSHSEAKEVLPELPDFEYEIVYDTASFLQFYSKKISLAGLQTITGIHQKQLSHYVTGKSRPTKATVLKIQNGISRFAKELSGVRLV